MHINMRMHACTEKPHCTAHELQAIIRDYALTEVLLRESHEKRELLGLAEHLTTDQAG